ncbi:MAG: PEP-CTERM sorting domain-containing protein [Candidatus Korobacteraceae bacterium]
MKKVALTLAVVLATAVIALAGNCPTTTYDQYLGSGFSCSINDQTYQDFAYTGTSNPPGFQIQAAGIGVTPITTPGDPGLQWSAGWGVGTSLGILSQDSLFQFAVTSTNPMTDLSLSIAGVGFSGTGSVNLDETACLGAMLPSCSGGTVVTLSVFANSQGQQLFDQVNFAGVNLIDVSKDLLVQAGTNGTAEVSQITDQFSEGSGTVPEPGTFGMLGAGILAVAGIARRKFNLF